METRFVEAGQGISEQTSANWGKFLVARYSGRELTEPTQFPMCEGQTVVDLRGPGDRHVWVLDLVTGEGVRFDWTTVRNAAAALQRHQVWVCPMFEPLVEWLVTHIRAAGTAWWDTLPRCVLLPDAPFALSGHRRPGPGQRARDQVRDLLTAQTVPAGRRR